MSCGVTYWDLSVLQHILGCQEPPFFSQPSSRCRTPPCTASHRATPAESFQGAN